MFDRAITFFKEARVELKKVTWPTRQEAIRHTITVVVISVAVAAYLGVLDYIFRTVLNTFVL
jgi:preprotein translocase subunit SecE